MRRFFSKSFSLILIILGFSQLGQAQCPSITITNHPADQTVQAGNTVSFSVTATGNNLTYEWESNINNTGWLPQGTGSINTYTTFSNVENGKQFRCIVFDGNCRDTSNVATLTVNPAPCNMFTVQPTNQIVGTQQPITFSATATGSNLYYRWEVQEPDSTTWTLQFSNSPTYPYTTSASILDEGTKVRCIVIEDFGVCGDTSDVATVSSVYYSSCNLITAQPTDENVALGGNASFSFSTGFVNYLQWEYKQPSIGINTWTAIPNANATSYSINNVTSQDDGKVFRCISGYNDDCRDTTNEVSLFISNCPHIITQPVNMNINDGGTTTFQVVTQGANLTYTWLSQLPNSSTWSLAGAGLTTGNSNLFTVGLVSLSDNGTKYMCVVSDGVCNDTSSVVMLTVYQNIPNVDTIRTYLGDIIGIDSLCIADTLVVPVYIEGGSNDIGSISMVISFQDTALGIIASGGAVHNVHSDLLANGQVLTSVPSNFGSTTANVFISWSKSGQNGVTFPTQTKVFELWFTHNGTPPNLLTTLNFNNTYAGYNEYGEASTAAVLQDDGFLDTHTIYADSAKCNGTITGEVTYSPSNTSVYGSGNLIEVTLKDMNGGIPQLPNNPQYVTTANGYTFTNVPPGQYTIELTDFDPNIGGAINSTDALRVTLDFLLQLPFQNGLQALAAETDGNGIGQPNATDALFISQRFIGILPSFDPLTTWVQESEGFTINSGDELVQNVQVMLRGDVNGSFDPSSLNGGDVSEVTLVLDDVIEITESQQQVDIPFRATESLEIGALSFVLNYPFDVLKIDNIILNEKVNSSLFQYTIENGRVRISWFNMQPLNLDAGEALFTIKATTLDNLSAAWTPSITRGNETELANGMGEVLEDVTLTIPQLILNIPNTVDEQFAVQAFPNPACEMTVLNIRAKAEGEMTLQVFNALGMLVKSENNIQIAAGVTPFQMEVSDLPIGHYNIQMTFEDENGTTQQVERLVIIR